jgi:hypothetical protein
MRRRLSLCALTLFTAAWAQEALAVVYVPGRYENGIYSRPHFRSDGEAGQAVLRLKRLVGSGKVSKDGELPADEEPEAALGAAPPADEER